MEEIRRVLQESRHLLEVAREDLEACQRLQRNELAPSTEGDVSNLSPRWTLPQVPPGPPPPPPPPAEEPPPEAARPLAREEIIAQRRPRKASEALSEAAMDTVPATASHATLEGDETELDDEEEESDDDFEITQQLNVGGAEDQVAEGPSMKLQQPLSDEELIAEDVELLLPPPKRNMHHEQMSMRTLRSPSQAPVGDGEADPEIAAKAEEEPDHFEDPFEEELKPKLTMMQKEGHLKKHPSTLKLFAGSHMRWFILRDEILLYCLSRENQRPRRMMKLLYCQCAVYRKGELNGPKPSVYIIFVVPQSPLERKFKLSTESEEEAREWHNAISNNIAATHELQDIVVAKAKLSRKTETRRTSQVGVDMAEQPREQPQTYYEIVGVPHNATTEQIRKTYYALARNYHPDKNPDVDAKGFAEVSKAYSILKDPVLRENYDLSETVKAAFRLGVLAIKHEDDGMFSTRMAFFMDRLFENLIWQPEERGSVLKRGYSRLEMRYVHKIYAGENDTLLKFGPKKLRQEIRNEGTEKEELSDDECRKRCLCIHVSPHALRQGYSNIFMELDTREARDDMLDGLRIIRCSSSMLFQQNFDEMMAKGMR